MVGSLVLSLESGGGNTLTRGQPRNTTKYRQYDIKLDFTSM